MVIGLRILALIIDCAICLGLLPLFISATGYAVEFLSNIGSGIQALFLLPLWFALIIVSPFLYFGITTGLWGRTPGKFICRLYVVDANNSRPGLWRGLGRETLKILAIACSIGAIIAFFQMLYHDVTWYDSVCGTQVHFKPYVRLTKTQKKYRKYMKEQQRGI